MQNDVPDLPSDDSEDDDFDPNISEEHVAGHVEGPLEEDISDSDDNSDFITSSDNSEHVKDKENVDDLELPSDDSEDDDYDPAGPDSDKDIEEKQDESDFISDSGDFCADIAKSCGKDDGSSCPKDGDHTTKDLEIDQAAILSSRGRQVQRLDYKTLYDDAYGDAPSDSSDGGDWSGQSTLKENEERNEVDSFAHKSSRGTRVVHSDGFHGIVNDQHAGGLITSDGQFGPIINERLGDQYPSRDAMNVGTPSGILNEGITQDGPLKHVIGVGPRTNASPPNCNKRYTIHYVRRRKGGSSRENNGKNSSASSAGRPKGGDSDYSVKTRNEMLPELKKF